MSLKLKVTNLGVNTEVDQLLALLNAGFLDIYDGTQPATADTAIGAQVKLAHLTFGNPAFGGSVGGLATANPITAASAAATGTASWFRAYKTDGTTAAFDGSVGSGGNKAITAATNANPVALTKATHGLVTGDRIIISGATGNWTPINGTWLVTRVDANSFNIAVDSSGFGALSGSPVFRDADLDLNTTSIVIGAQVSVSSYTFTLGKG